MTCEVLVMNRYGVALAADSAVSLRNGRKVYHHAQKIFPLRTSIPVGLMLYGSAELLGMPWEIVIRLYAQELGETRFDRLEQYGEDFLRFVGNAASLFPEEVQKDEFRKSVCSYWETEILDPLKGAFRKSGCSSSRQVLSELAAILERENRAWERHDRLSQCDESHVEKILTKYGPVLKELEQTLFGEIQLDAASREGLRQTVRHMYTRQWFAPDQQTGIVFAGMGEAEPFAEMRQYNVGSVAAGVLHWSLGDKASIARTDSAIVIPFAQAEEINMFFRGIDKGLEDRLETIIEDTLSEELAATAFKLTACQIESAKNRFRKSLREEITSKYTGPLMEAVDGLPRHGLARVAKELINLTALRRNLSVDRREAVGGHTIAAVLSKGEGFAWVEGRDAVQGARRDLVPNTVLSGHVL